MNWAAIALTIITEFPELVAVLQKWVSLGKTPTVEDLAAELSQLDVDDAKLAAAYQRAFPGQTPPQ